MTEPTSKIPRRLAIVRSEVDSAGKSTSQLASSAAAGADAAAAGAGPGEESRSGFTAGGRSAELAAGPADRSFQVGELAKRTGKTVRAIHLYEAMGLLEPAQRSRGRFRLYNLASLERVAWISQMQAAGFSLGELKELVLAQDEAQSGKDASSVLRGAYVDKLASVREKLAELHRLEQGLLSSLTYLDACQSACDDNVDKDCCPQCSRHGDQPEPPALVSGARAR